jgi:xyloglucan-specific exo-beta-1,4-glucanase
MYRSEQSAILRSSDKGNTWKIYPVSFRMGGNEDGRGMGERLAIDPNDNHILYFGSPNDGLMRSMDRGVTWQKVESFPLPGRGLPDRGPANGGLSFVVFNPHSGPKSHLINTRIVQMVEPYPSYVPYGSFSNTEYSGI